MEVAKGLFTQDFKVHLVNSDGTFSDEHLDTNSFYYGTLDGKNGILQTTNEFLNSLYLSVKISIAFKKLTLCILKLKLQPKTSSYSQGPELSEKDTTSDNLIF